MTALNGNTFQRFATLAILIIAGEIIFSLPFHIPRFFRPTMLEVFGLTNTQLGDIFALYGVVALLAYFPGGAIADRYSARGLMTVSLLATALGGLYLYTLPTRNALYWLFGFWGLTSILLFWAALIKATRDWGGNDTQGIAFGMLDGGRGLVASVFATVAVLILSQQLASSNSSVAALQGVIAFYTAASLITAALVWFALPESTGSAEKNTVSVTHNWRHIVSEPSVWLQAGVVVCAYCGYKALDNYGVYAVAVLGMNEVEAARLTTLASYTRPVAAIAAGLWADRWHSSRLVMLLFAVAALVFLYWVCSL
ncbi:nitrate/nitrite transporter [Oceanicoccus sp. KOV_DT_Chl]|uniref:MFS transporter n=1 Tax=Oceanicoccus sp. KOV_DT_Chl TaxID=1904639 RepID=UPI00190EF7A3|nr:MFS transporter [Oceanicoccus sp. KOV_DT_Chl]